MIEECGWEEGGSKGRQAEEQGDTDAWALLGWGAGPKGVALMGGGTLSRGRRCEGRRTMGVSLMGGETLARGRRCDGRRTEGVTLRGGETLTRGRRCDWRRTRGVTTNGR